MVGLILYWVTALVARKNNLDLRKKINATNKKLVASFKYLKLKEMVKSNFDIKPAVIKLFFFSYWTNLFFLAVTIFINAIYTTVFFFTFFHIQTEVSEYAKWPEIGILILNILCIFFFIRMTTSYYKLSWRGEYRKNYFKVFFLDLLALNILDVVGTLIFFKNKKNMVPLHYDFQITNDSLNSKMIKSYLRLLWKIEIFIFLFNVVLFSIALILGYFINSTPIKWASLFIIIWSIVIIYGWSLPRLIWMFIFQKTFHNLLKSNNYYYLLSTIRLLVLGFGCYYFAILINLFKFDQEFTDFLLNNW